MPTVAAVWGAALLANYRNVAGATLFIYDSLIMFPAEIEEKIYWSKWRQRSIATTIYPIMKLVGILYFVGSLYQHIYPNVSQAGCLMAVWVTGIALDIGYTSIIKLILVLRLRAIYRHDRKVSILLYTLMTIEMIGALGALIGFIAVSTKYPAEVPFPFPGCWSVDTGPPFSIFYEKTALVLWITRFSTTAIEAILMLIKLGEALNKERRLSDKSLWSAVLELRRLTPVLYIFYRDGALLFIPIFVLNTMGIIGKTTPGSRISEIDWSMWLLLTYQICGSRLLLNIRRANEKLTSSIVPQYLSTLRFESQGSTNDEYFKSGQNMAMNPLLHHHRDSSYS